MAIMFLLKKNCIRHLPIVGIGFFLILGPIVRTKAESLAGIPSKTPAPNAPAKSGASTSSASTSSTTTGTQPTADTSTASTSSTPSQAGISGENNLSDLPSLEQLTNITVGAAGLTAMDKRSQPVDVFTIDAHDIQESGAQDLDHLLEIYVPGAQILLHQTPATDFGMRGIMSDREDKYLYQVNGVTLNNRMLYGANIERDLPIMGDLNTVNVVEGPASATYGSGAISGVISVQTYTGLTFQGLDMTAKQGFINQYSTGEIRYGKKFDSTSGLFLYYGAAYVQGVDAPFYFGKSEPAKNGLPANVAGQPYSGPKARLGGMAFDTPWQKAHVSYVNGPFEIWSRFTQDGTDTENRRDIYTLTNPSDNPLSRWTDGRSLSNSVWTTAINYKEDLSPQWNLNALQSFDSWWVKDQRDGVSGPVPIRNSNEEQLFNHVVATWTPVEQESLAFGEEYSHIWYHDPPQSDALDTAPSVPKRDWETDTISFLMENQWKINKQFTLFLSAREDKNTYTGWLLSPRATLVYEPTKVDTIKLMAGKAVRRGDDEDIWGVFQRTGADSQPETLKSYEVAYERQLTNELNLHCDTYYEDYTALGWSPALLMDAELGEFEMAGGDIVLTYRADHARVTFSEGITKLLHSSVPSILPVAGQGISSASNGYGNDLASTSPSITKLAVDYDLLKQLTASGSVIYYYGFPGAQDYANYTATLAHPPSGVPLSDPGNNLPYGPNLYVNLGLEYRPNEHITARFDAYNLPAMFDPTLSKRNYILRGSEFSVQPTSLALSLRYSF